MGHNIIVCYKSYRYIDGKARWIITDENNNIINKSPTVEQLKNAIIDPKRNKSEPTRNLENRRCYKCGNNITYVDSAGNHHWYVVRNEDTCWKDTYMCSICYYRYHHNLPDSYDNLIKSMADCRIGNVDTYSSQGIFIMAQAVVANVHKIEDLNIKKDNFGWYIDMENKEYGKIDVKSSKLHSQKYIDLKGNISTYCAWNFPTRRKIDCDTYICIGFNKDLTYIEAVWTIPNEGWINNLHKIGLLGLQNMISSKLIQNIIMVHIKV